MGQWIYDVYDHNQRVVRNEWRDDSGQVREEFITRFLKPDEVYIPAPPKQHPVLESLARQAAILKTWTDAQRPKLSDIHEHLLSDDSYLDECGKKEIREQIKRDQLRRDRNA